MRVITFLIKATLVSTVCLLILLSVAIFMMQTKPFKDLPIIGDYEPLMVLSGSMEPQLKVGSVVFIGRVDTDQIREGDIITFSLPVELNQGQPSGQTLVTHRVVAVIEQGRTRLFQTKGDANNDVDARLVDETDVKGRERFDIPYLGYVSHYLRGRSGFLILVSLGLVIIAYEISSTVIRVNRERFVS
ncbi:signal peptidase I W [bacterium BMS3Abin01]|nr:signal peptidase I W [bacterium BMS3Abin01]